MGKTNNLIVAERFYKKVKVADKDSCWEWQAGLYPDDYGHFWLNGKHVVAHRYAWILENGEIPDGMCVCHRCDNCKCVNPSHLFLGTHQDNMDDMNEKGRGIKQWGGRKGGITKNTRKNTQKRANKIRCQYAKGGLTQVELANKYGLHRKSIARILKSKPTYPLG